MVVMKVFGILLFLCGSSFAAVPSDSKIVGGYAVFIQEVPYQVSLRLRNLHYGDPFHICGAAIISAYNILTAAHCESQTIIGITASLIKACTQVQRIQIQL